MKIPKNKNTELDGIHEGHRKRVMERFEAEGLDSFQPHQVLELLLFFTIKRKDTNLLAHQLLKKFGTLTKILESEPKDLMQVDGIGYQTAVYLSVFGKMNRYYSREKIKKKSDFISSPQKGGAYAKALLKGHLYETFYVICLNTQNKVVHFEKINEGTINEIAVYPRKIVEVVIRHQAHSILLAHNHPGGSLVPTREDIESTTAIKKALEPLGVKITDHFIVADDAYMSFLEMKIPL